MGNENDFGEIIPTKDFPDFSKVTDLMNLVKDWKLIFWKFTSIASLLKFDSAVTGIILGDPGERKVESRKIISSV